MKLYIWGHPSYGEGLSPVGADGKIGRWLNAGALRAFAGMTVLCLILAGAAHAAVNENDISDNEKGASGLTLPRFATLRSNEVNMRTGPGTRYPIEWVFSHQGLPVEITAEYEIWRRVRDSEGAEGWVHKSALTGKRGAIITGSLRELRSSPDPASESTAHLEPGAVGQLLSCTPDWCKLKFNGIKGYLRKNEFWGAYPKEVFD